MKRLILTNLAVNDLDDIWTFIAAESVDAANRVEVELHEAMLQLCDAPWKGHKRADVPNKTLRFWPLYSYVIAYRVEGEDLCVWRVVHGARNFRAMFPKRQRRK